MVDAPFLPSEEGRLDERPGLGYLMVATAATLFAVNGTVFQGRSRLRPLLARVDPDSLHGRGCRIPPPSAPFLPQAPVRRPPGARLPRAVRRHRGRVRTVALLRRARAPARRHRAPDPVHRAAL